MQTPGAAMACPVSEPPEVVQLLKSAAVSSTSARQVAEAPPPGWPLKSAIAVTVSTSLYAAGTKPLKSALLLPAATTYVTPAVFTEAQMALCSASLSGARPPAPEPPPPRLMFAPLIFSPAALTVTQSAPQMTEDHVPEPALFNTRTAYRGAPGATPTTPIPSSLAATVPATWVP